jgi:hypothetical protein
MVLKKKRGDPKNRAPRFYFSRLLKLEARIGSAQELLWNFSLRERAWNFRTPIASSIYKGHGE